MVNEGIKQPHFQFIQYVVTLLKDGRTVTASCPQLQKSSLDFDFPGVDDVQENVDILKSEICPILKFFILGGSDLFLIYLVQNSNSIGGEGITNGQLPKLQVPLSKEKHIFALYDINHGEEMSFP